MSFSELPIEDQPDLSQYRFLNSLASPGRTEIASMDRRQDVHTAEERRIKSKTASQENSPQDSLCKSDLDEN